MKGQDKPKKPAKKPAQKTLKERRAAKRDAERQGSPARRLSRAPRPRASGKRPSVHWPAWIRMPSPCWSSRRSSSGSRASTESARGAELARELAPSADAGEVARRQALTAEGIALLDDAAEPSLAGLADVRDGRGARGPRRRARAARPAPRRDGGRGRARGAARARRGAPSWRRCSRELLEPVEPSLALARRGDRRAASRTTAPTCATTPRPRCGACAASCATASSA